MATDVRRYIWIRHGETEGESSIRYHGTNDVRLSGVGRAQMQLTAARIEISDVDRVVSSTLSRAFESTEVVARGIRFLREDDFREVHFGRWEGLTAEEIETLDPELFALWRQQSPSFDYPEGERRADFQARVRRAVDRWKPAKGETVLVVAHKGVIRVALEYLGGEILGDEEPRLAGMMALESREDGPWNRLPDRDLPE